MLTDALEIRFIDMVKFRRMYNNRERYGSFFDDPLHRWVTFFDKNSPTELIEEVVKMDTAIQKAQERITFITQDEASLRAYEMREKAIMDWNSAIGYHTREIARKLKADNMSTDQIIKYTGLTEKQVNEL